MGLSLKWIEFRFGFRTGIEFSSCSRFWISGFDFEIEFKGGLDLGVEFRVRVVLRSGVGFVL